MITSALPSSITGIARSWMSRSSSQPCCQIQRRTGSLRRSKIDRRRSEAEVCEFFIGIDCGIRVMLLERRPPRWVLAPIRADITGADQVTPACAGVLREQRHHVDEGGYRVTRRGE